MRVSVDSAIFVDPRFKLLARGLGLAWQHTLGALLAVWNLCYERRSPVVPRVEVDVVSEVDGFAAAMVKAGLASDAADDRVRIAGAEERVQFLIDQRERAQRGAKKRWGSSTMPDGMPNGIPSGMPHAVPYSSASASALPSPSDQEHVGARAADVLPAKRRASKKPADAHPEHAEVRNHVRTLYREHTGGEEHPWGPKQAGQLSGLLKQADAATVKARAVRLWRETPEWIRKGGTVPTLDTLVAQFAGLAAPVQRGPRAQSLADAGYRSIDEQHPASVVRR